MRRYKPPRPNETTDTRSPEARLESLVREPNRERGRRMLARIRQDLERAPEPAAWIAAARTLSERLIISENAFYYFVGLFTEPLIGAAFDSDPELRRLSGEVEAIERAHGLEEDESFHLDDAPSDWTAANEAWDRRADQIIVDYLRAHRNADLASLIESNRQAFEDRSSAGYGELWGEDDDGDEADRL